MRTSGLIAAATALLLGGCFGPVADTPQPRATAYTAATGSVASLVGKWGVASYRKEEDLKRTEAMARAHCRQPYEIKKGPTDGVMMHVADDSKLYELTTKAGPKGKTYLGFNAPPGHDQDREFISHSNEKFRLKFVNPDIHTRYGIYIYVRCPGQA